ncbi:hypothetical protein BJV82DRAFT_666870 [Fennellomyces sp. T-0311]|nr:hypothetical protein BJV82DRAFT_666870 [Fennellomyces sp. T-0311]
MEIESNRNPLVAISDAMEELSTSMQLLVRNQVELKETLMQQKTQQERDRSVHGQDSNGIPLREVHIRTLVWESNSSMTESQLEGLMGSIKHHADVSVKALKHALNGSVERTWTNLPPERNTAGFGQRGICYLKDGITNAITKHAKQKEKELKGQEEADAGRDDVQGNHLLLHRKLHLIKLKQLSVALNHPQPPDEDQDFYPKHPLQ